MKLYVCVGMIASGKSTWARGQADKGAVVISHDDLTAMLHARYRYEQRLRQAYRDSEELLADVWLAFGRDVIIDRTHLTRESRERWTRFARRRDVECVAVCFATREPEVHAYRRLYSDARGRSYEDWLGVARHHADQARLEPLDYVTEGFDDVRIIREPILPGLDT